MPVHGDCKIYVEDNIIFAEASGPWNLEFFVATHKKLIAAGSKVNLANYAMLVKPIAEAVAVQEAIDMHIDFIRKSGVKAIGVNLSKSTCSAITKSLCENAYDIAQIPYRFFQDTESAVIWLKSILGEND